MIYLLLAITFGSLFAIIFKLFARQGIETSIAITLSYVAAMVIGSIYTLTTGSPSFDFQQYIIPALITGAFMAGAFITMNRATLSHGVAIATISARLSFIIPVVCSFLFFHSDTPRWGIIALIAASLILIFYRGRDTQTTTSGEWFYPILVFLCYGISNFLLKHLQQSITNAGGSDYELQVTTHITFLGAFIVAMLYAIKQSKNQQRKLAVSWREIVAAAILGGANLGCTFFLMKSLTVIDTSVFYPTYNIAIVTIATIVGRVCFGERLSVSQYIGIALAITSILFFFNTI